MAKKTSIRMQARGTLWTLGALILPAAALVYLFIWSQARNPLTAGTEIQRAALALEELAENALERAVVKATDFSTDDPLAIRITFRSGADQGIRVLDPRPAEAKKVWDLAEGGEEAAQYEIFLAALDEQEFVLKDLDRATATLKVLQDGFLEEKYQVRTTLARAAFLKRRERFAEAKEGLLSLIREKDPAAAPALDFPPFVAAALLLLADAGPVPEDDLEKILSAILEGALPLTPDELRILADRLGESAPQAGTRLKERARALDLVAVLQEAPGLGTLLQESPRCAALSQGWLWLGRHEQGEAMVRVYPQAEGLARLQHAAQVEPDEGLAWLLEAGDIPLDEELEAVRNKEDPAAILGAVLHVVLVDREPFERNLSTQRTFVITVALCLISAMVLLGFATFRAVRREVAAAKARTDFMTAVSHELRTPLASIRMFAELLDQGRVPEEETRNRFMRLILSNCRRLSAMIENVLDLGRSERGLLRFQPTEVDIRRLLEDLLGDIRVSLEEDGFQVQVRLAKDLPPVRADASALTRALFNLCDNARKYSGENKSIEVEAVSRKAGVRISIRDQGPGISAAERKRLFQPFQRGTGADRAASGAGMGLFLARQAIEACGGALTLESSEGPGATFHIVLRQWNPKDDGPHEEDTDH